MFFFFTCRNLRLARSAIDIHLPSNPHNRYCTSKSPLFNRCFITRLAQLRPLHSKVQRFHHLLIFAWEQWISSWRRRQSIYPPNRFCVWNAAPCWNRRAVDVLARDILY